MVTKKKPATRKTAAKKPARKTARKKPAMRAKASSTASKTAPIAAKKSRGFLKAFLIFLFGGVLGTGFGAVVGYVLYPFIDPPPPANDIVVEEEKQALAAVGQFIHANPRDPIHFGSGSVTVYRKLVHLGKDFKVGPGPRYHVYLSPREKIRKNDDFSKAASLDLGRLRSFEGSQKFKIPEGTDLSQYKSVVIWCVRFNVLISPADLKKVSMIDEKQEQ